MAFVSPHFLFLKAELKVVCLGGTCPVSSTSVHLSLIIHVLPWEETKKNKSDNIRGRHCKHIKLFKN